MIQKERLEGVVIASPLFTHADIAVGCMEAGLHVLCEKMMAWTTRPAGAWRTRPGETGRVLEIGHQRYYNPIYQASYDGIVKAGLLGEVYHARLVWHRNGNWRRKADLPSPDYSAAPWGYPTFDHLVNWRLYKQYSRGHMAELASHMVAITDWFFGATAEAAIGQRRRLPLQGRARGAGPHLRHARVPGRPHRRLHLDRVERLRQLLRGLLRHEGHADPQGRGRGLPLRGGCAGRRGEGDRRRGGPEGRARRAPPPRAAPPTRRARARAWARPSGGGDRLAAYRYEVNGFCGAVRTGAPLECGPERALASARACIAGFDAIETKTRIEIKA